MKITVVGLGAIGGLLAARLALAGHPVSALARGATLNAVREQGLVLQSGGRTERIAIEASDDPRTLGPQDLIVIALKAQALPGIAPDLPALMHADTCVMPAMNGVPWWFLRTPELGQRLTPDEQHLDSVDPGHGIEAALPLPQVLACVVHLTCAQRAPGVIAHAQGNRLIIGEPLGGLGQRAGRIAEVFNQAGFAAEPSANIRGDIWYKLWGNMTANPVSALTGATADAILDDPLVRGFLLRTMAEAAAIGDQIGCPIHQSGEDRLNLTRQLGAFKTSMLQDAEAGRSLELDALVSAVREIGLKLGIATPNIDAVLGLTRLMARTRGLYPAV